MSKKFVVLSRETVNGTEYMTVSLDETDDVPAMLTLAAARKDGWTLKRNGNNSPIQTRMQEAINKLDFSPHAAYLKV